MLIFLSNGLVIVGACILIAALLQIHKLILQFPSGQVRRKWFMLNGLITLFIIGYISYAIFFWNHNTTMADLIVPGVFFFGAAFVLLTANISLQTAADIRRVTILEQENISDSLTGIYNRRYLDRRLEEECARSKRYHLPLAILLIDIDHFKQINDTHGHQIGDLVLRNLGTLLQQVIRDSDIAARYGGDEVMIIAPNTTLSLASALAERLRQHMETQELSLTNGIKEPVELSFTISIGVAALCEGDADCGCFIQNVDAALFRAKQAGRNRIAVHQDNLTERDPFTV
jgi:diguanylate cyclase (GGDEF)-like protein